MTKSNKECCNGSNTSYAYDRHGYGGYGGYGSYGYGRHGYGGYGGFYNNPFFWALLLRPRIVGWVNVPIRR